LAEALAFAPASAVAELSTAFRPLGTPKQDVNESRQNRKSIEAPGRARNASPPNNLPLIEKHAGLLTMQARSASRRKPFISNSDALGSSPKSSRLERQILF